MDKELNIKGLFMHSIIRMIGVLLVLFSVSTTTYAALKGKGTAADPYIIAQATDFNDLRTTIKSNQGKYLYVKQVADVDVSSLSSASTPVFPLAGMNYSGGKLRIASPETYFLGSYDGGGYTVSNWSIKSTKMDSEIKSKAHFFISMFGKVGANGSNKSVIKNLNIDGFDIDLVATSSEKINPNGCGFIVSDVTNSEITNCNVINSKAAGNGHFVFGAIAANTDQTTISNCTVKDCEYSPKNGAQSVGSICGINSGNIKNCFAYNVTLNGRTYVGGVVGVINSGVVENCGFNGKIGTLSDVFELNNSGGICGYLIEGSIINCFSVFDNDGSSWRANVIGGIVGLVIGNANAEFKNCYAYPRVRLEGLQDDNVDFIVGLDEDKNNSNKVYESCYCYENAYGVGFEPKLITGVDFTPEYMEQHKLLVASNDFMKSGCFTEVLSDYQINTLRQDNVWREDVEFQNDTLPVLKFMVDKVYDEDPFCHPGIYTMSHSESGSISKINGRLKYITDDQLTEGWLYGFEVKEGNGKWNSVDNSKIKSTPNGNKIDFSFDYTYKSTTTTVYRAYTQLTSTSRKAYGQIDTICVGSSSGPIYLTGCDSVEYEGKWYFPKDNGIHTIGSEEVEININETKRNIDPFVLKGKCGDESVTDNGVTYYQSGTYSDTTINSTTGCLQIQTRNVILYPTLQKDSLKVFELGEMSYTYTSISGIKPLTVEVSNEYVLDPKQLVVDQVRYKDYAGCDSVKIVVKYAIPIKITNIEDATWSCEPVVYNGKTYTKETSVKDTVKTPHSTYKDLYDIMSRHIKVLVADTINDTRTWCGEIMYDCPQGPCFTTEPFYDTLNVPSSINGCQCPASVQITHHVLGVQPTREENISNCGTYILEYKGEKTPIQESKDTTFIRSGNNLGSCDNDTLVTYHITINNAPKFADTTIHSCGTLYYKTLSGEFKTFNESQDFVDEYVTPQGCSSTRNVHIYIHKTEIKSAQVPYQDCAPYTYKKFNGETIVLNAGSHTISDTIRSTDECGCDSIIKITKFILEDPVTFDLIEVNECNQAVIENVTYTKDTSFVLESKNSNLNKVCKRQFQPYKVTINSSIVEEYHIDTCGVYYIEEDPEREAFKTSGKKTVSIPNETGCDNKHIYDIRIVEPKRIDSTVYACEEYIYTFFDGSTKTVVDDGEIIIDKIQSKVCSCDSVIRQVTVYISHNSTEILPPVTNCGPYTYVKKSTGKKLLIGNSQIVRDTLVNKYGCSIYYETEVTIIPVETKIEVLDACKEYHSIEKVFNYGNQPVDVVVSDQTVKNAELIFLKPNVLHPTCNDTTKLFLSVHGVGNITAEPVVECDTFFYTDFDGSQKTITSSTVILDTLKSTVCDCDSIIKTTNVTINYSLPEESRKTVPLRACDSVVYKNSKGINMVFNENTTILDTFPMKKTGCDSVVIYDITVPKSTGKVVLLSVCGDTTLYDELNDNYPHEFNESGIWRQVLSKNEEGCDNYIEWRVDVTPTPRVDKFESGCGELSFKGVTYTSENEKARTFSLELLGNTKCDTVYNYNLTVYPKYNHSEQLEGCEMVKRNGVIYRQSIFFQDTLMSRNNCDSVINVNITVHEAKNIYETISDCNVVMVKDTDYNDGNPVYVHHDSTIYIDKINENGCPYQLVKKIEVLHPSYVPQRIVECVNPELGYVKFRNYILKSDTTIYDTIPSDNKCGTIIANIVNVIDPESFMDIHDTIADCNEVKFIDEDYNGGAPVYVHKDSTIQIVKKTNSGCEYHLITDIQVGHTSYEENYLYECYDASVGYVKFRDLRLLSDTIVYDTLTSSNRCGHIVANIINVIMPTDTDVRDTLFGCDKLVFIDEDFNGGLPVSVSKDSIINVVKTTLNGCSYNLTHDIHIGHPTLIKDTIYEGFDSKNGYALYRDLKLVNDTVIIDTVSSSNRCGSIVNTFVDLVMPIHDTIFIEDCLYVTYKDSMYNDSTEIRDTFKIDDAGVQCDSISHIIINVNRCFPYPVIVNKYNWILVCNDIIFDDDRFKLKSNVKYNWYKNDQLILSTSDSYFTEDQELNGCYQVGIIIENGTEYFSDVVCFDEGRGYSISAQPNPVDKLQAVSIICDFPEEGVIGTQVEVFNMTADKVYESKATANEVVIPGMAVSGYYLVRLTTVSGKVLTTKYVVK